MATLTTSLDNIRYDARQAISAGSTSRVNPGAGLAQEVGSSVKQSKQQQIVENLPKAAETTPEEPKRDSIRVSSTLGKAASSGQLTRQEAVAIYKEISSLL